MTSRRVLLGRTLTEHYPITKTFGHGRHGVVCRCGEKVLVSMVYPFEQVIHNFVIHQVNVLDEVLPKES